MTIKDIQENLKLNCSSKTKKMIIGCLFERKIKINLRDFSVIKDMK